MFRSWFWGKVAVTGIVACLAVSSTGCKSLLKKKLGGDAGASSTSSNLTPQDLVDEQMQEKLDEYIKCLNSLSSSIGNSRRRYLSYIPKAGPTGREQTADIYKLSPTAAPNCAMGVTKSKSMPPVDAKLEAAGSEFSLAASAADRAILDMFNYFELKNFRDDRWAKGKMMHPVLMAAFSRFSTADKNLHDTLDGITKPLAQRTLGRIEREEGKKFRYGRKKVLITSRTLIEAADPVGEDADVDFNLYGAAYSDFEKALDELSMYGSMHKNDLSNQALAPSWPLASTNYDAFVKQAGDFKKGAKEFWRCLRDAPARAKTPSGRIDMEKMGNCADGPAWKQGELVIKEYNEFIRTSNNQPFP